jgi:hypothetical protein
MGHFLLLCYFRTYPSAEMGFLFYAVSLAAGIFVINSLLWAAF